MSVQSALRPRQRRRRLLGSKAARALFGPRLVPAIDRELWHLAGIEAALDRSMGSALERLQAGRRYRQLGFELWRDHVRERVGVAMRWTQYLKLLACGCDAVPAIGTALARSEITTWKAILLFAVVGRGTAAPECSTWLARARALSVRRLQRAVAAARRQGVVGITGELLAAEGAAPGEVPDPRAPEPGEWMDFRVPYRTAELWRVARETADRVSQAPLPAYRCFELLVAERVRSDRRRGGSERAGCGPGRGGGAARGNGGGAGAAPHPARPRGERSGGRGGAGRGRVVGAGAARRVVSGGSRGLVVSRMAA